MQEKPSILIVDDDASLCQTMSIVLKRNGYSVTTVKDGPEAIKRVSETDFDMIFMDIKMPLMNGVEAYRSIQKIRPQAEVVVMMTAYSVEDLIQEALQVGAREILHKPLNMEKVIALVEEVRKIRSGAVVMVAEEGSEHASPTKTHYGTK